MSRIPGRTLLLLLASAWLLGAGCATSPDSAAPARPKLVVLLIVDGLPQRQVVDYRDELGPDGLRRFLDRGAWFSQAHFGHAHTVTATGHATIVTGTYPYRHGIIGNAWRDPATGEIEYCTGDPAHGYIGHPAGKLDGTSPRNLRAETVGDVLKRVSASSRVIALSLKDRAAILAAGKAGVAYMYLAHYGEFASTTYYMKEHPRWVQEYNARRHAPTPGPSGDGMLLDFARAAIAGEGLGKDDAPDLLAVSLSSHDAINHAYSAESRLSHDHVLQIDRLLEAFFRDLDATVGRDSYLAVLTADHGFMPAPEHSLSLGRDAGRQSGSQAIARVNAALQRKFGPGAWIRYISAQGLVFDKSLIAKSGADVRAVSEEARRALLAEPGIAVAYTREELETGSRAGQPHFDAMRKTWHRELSGDLQFALKPYWMMSSSSRATHGSPHPYDTHVPILLYGPAWVKPGRHDERVEVIDIAPTLAHVLGVPAPAASEGKLLPVMAGS